MSKKRVEWNVLLKSSNLLTLEEHDLVPKVILNGTLTLDELIARLTASRACPLNAETLRHAAATLASGIEEYLVGGYAVSTPLGTLTPSVTGTWSTDRLQPEERRRNQATVRFTSSPRLQKALANPLFHELGMGSFRRLDIYSVEDIASHTRGERLTPGGVITLRGRFLLMNGDLPQRGLYLLDADSRAEVCHLRPEQFILNTRGRIIVQLPAQLPPGEYLLRVVSQCTTSPRPMKQPAECVCETRFRVAADDGASETSASAV